MKKYLPNVLKNIARGVKNNISFVIDITKKPDLKRRVSLCTGFINIYELNCANVKDELADYLCSMYLKHRFDLLGSGWISYDYNSESYGFENLKYNENLVIKSFDKKGEWLKNILLRPHRRVGKKIWEKVDEEYIPIDWQKDVKSGYRWSSKKWYRNQKVAPLPGVDIKIPWELGRFQFLPQLAICCVAIPSYKIKIIKEFKNIVLDFITANPPRMGVNWASTMDVAIRAINLLMAYDLFIQLDNNCILDDDFNQIFANMIYDHGTHIYHNLEYSKNYTNNHYLSNIIGLIVISKYIKDIPEAKEWLNFAIREFITETKKQFNENGTNYEGATAYHCLSAEMILIALAFLKNDVERNVLECDLNMQSDQEALSQSVGGHSLIPEEIIKRIYNAGCYIESITKPNGEIPQIGDNDSGRIIKLMEAGNFITKNEAKTKYRNLSNYEQDEELYWDTNSLNYQPLLAYWSGMFDDGHFHEYNTKYPLEASFIATIINNKKIKIEPDGGSVRYNQNSGINCREFEYQSQTEFRPDKEDNETLLTDNGCFLSFEECGVFLYKSSRVYLIISARTDKSKVISGHLHNDVSSFELAIDGKCLILDPGTYVYTSHIQLRNKYRSTFMHNVINIDSIEQNSFGNDLHSLFFMRNDCHCKLMNLGENTAEFEIAYNDVINHRKFEILSDKVLVTDKCNKPFRIHYDNNKLYSRGYGKLINYNN